VILLLIVILGVILIVVVTLVVVDILLPLGVVGDEVGGVTTLEVVPGVSGVSSPLLLRLVHHPKFPCKQSNLTVENALVLLIKSAARADKANYKEDEMVLVALVSWPPTQALVIKALLVNEAS
jgi:hypothetical protein